MTVRWYGDKVLKEVEEQAMELVEKKGEAVKKDAKDLAPVATGALRDSIELDVDKADLTVRIGSNLDYALAQELGTARIAAHPYLRPALEKAKG